MKYSDKNIVLLLETMQEQIKEYSENELIISKKTNYHITHTELDIIINDIKKE